MCTRFIYRIRHAGSTVDSFTTDLEYVKEMSEQGNVVSCKRFKGVMS